jgi:hypothetical protein
MIKLPIACAEIPSFLEVGKDVCFFQLDDHPRSIARRVIEYLAHTNTHQMFRTVMRKYMLDVLCRKELMPFLRDIISNTNSRVTP